MSLFIVQVKSSSPFVWNDNFSYSSTSQLEAGGWQITQNPAGISFVNGALVLDGTNGDTSIAYENHFLNGIVDWKAQTNSMWLGKGHSGAQVHVDLLGHNYAWATDGWYSDFAFYVDGQKISAFGSYIEQANAWVNMTLEKQGNIINMYYNGLLEKSYTETNLNIVNAQVQGVSQINPWEGNQAYNFYQLESISNVASASTPTYTGTFSFKAWIDGLDYVYVQRGGATVWYEHMKSNLPGYELNNAGEQANIQNHGNVPTYIDGNIWYPTWANITTSWIDIHSFSSKYVSPKPHPTGEWNMTRFTVLQTRGNLTIIDYPSAGNDYTAKILLDDYTFLPNGTNPTGATWYEFNMDWQSNSPLSGGDVTKTAWVPPVSNAAATVVLASVALGVLSLIAAAATTTPATAATGSFLQTVIDKIRNILPDAFKKWLEALIASKRKLRIDEKTGSPYLLTKSEIAVYIISIILLTLSFSYVKVSTLEQFLIVLPTFFATSILVGLVRIYVGTLYSRKKGVWTEYKLWYFGIGLFVLSTFALKVPFSSPTRTVHHKRNFTDRLAGELSLIGILITLGFAAFFFILLQSGQALIGGTGLGMCIIGAFFDTYPIEPMGGKDIYKYNKPLWVILFVATLVLYIVWLMHII